MLKFLQDSPVYILVPILWIISFILIRRTFAGRMIYLVNVLILIFYIVTVVIPDEQRDQGIMKHFASGFDIALELMGWSILLLIVSAIKRGTESDPLDQNRKQDSNQ